MSQFSVLLTFLTSILVAFQRMNSLRAKGQRRGQTTARGNLNPPQDQVEEVAMPFNLAKLTDAEVRASLAHMT